MTITKLLLTAACALLAGAIVDRSGVDAGMQAPPAPQLTASRTN